VISAQCEGWLSASLGKFSLLEQYTGANNIGYRVNAAQQSYFLKIYPSGRSAKERMEREFAFSEFCRANGIANIPSIQAVNKQAHCVLFDYIDGERADSTDIGFIRSAIDLVCHFAAAEYDALPLASEAAFSFADFAALVRRRIAQFDSQTFAHSFQVECNNLVAAVASRFAKMPEDNEVMPKFFLPSLSDFGAHNSLFAEGRYFFIDLEYAGIDSACKCFCDFFAQPAFPVPVGHAKFFYDALPAEYWPSQSLLVKSYEATLLKWVLIILNTHNRMGDTLTGLKLARRYFAAIDSKLDTMKSSLGVM
jgi:hypothetical protein